MHAHDRSGGDDVRRQSGPGPRPVVGLLRLQATAGNAAVQRLLGAAVQRCGPVPCDCSPQERTEAEAAGGDASAAHAPAAGQRDGEGGPPPWTFPGPAGVPALPALQQLAGNAAAGRLLAAIVTGHRMPVHGGADGHGRAEDPHRGQTEPLGRRTEPSPRLQRMPALSRSALDDVLGVFGTGDDQEPVRAEPQGPSGLSAGSAEGDMPQEWGPTAPLAQGGQDPQRSARAGDCHYLPGEKERGRTSDGHVDDYTDESTPRARLAGFAPAESTLKPAHKAFLAALVSKFSLDSATAPKARVRSITGFTDCVDKEGRNSSIRRARAFATGLGVLDAKGHVDDSVYIDGTGPEEQPVDNSDEVHRSYNRSSLVVLEPKAQPPKPPVTPDWPAVRMTHFAARIEGSGTFGELGQGGGLELEIYCYDSRTSQRFAFTGAGIGVSLKNAPPVGSGGHSDWKDFTLKKPAVLGFREFTGPGRWSTGQAQFTVGPSADFVTFFFPETFQLQYVAMTTSSDPDAAGVGASTFVGAWSRQGSERSSPPGPCPSCP